MKRNVVLSMLLLVPFLVFAQRLNSKGQKMVSRLSMTVKEINNNIKLDWVSWDITFMYDPKGNLIGLDKEFTDEGATYTEKYRLDETSKQKKIRATVYKNGELLPHNKILIEPNVCRIEDYVTYDGNTIVHFNKDVHFYHNNALGICRTEKERFLGISLADTKWEVETFFKRLDYTRKSSIETWIERDCGFVDKLNERYATKDSIIYLTCRHFGDMMNSTISMNHTFIDGNMQNQYWADEKGNVLRENIYSDRLNDTNLEFYGFTQIGTYPLIVYRNVEWATEWMRTRSKNLMLMEERRYKKGKNYEMWLKENHPARYESEMQTMYKDWKAMCKAKWDYVFDENDNIKQITVYYNTGSFGEILKYVIDLEYAK